MIEKQQGSEEKGSERMSKGGVKCTCFNYNFEDYCH